MAKKLVVFKPTEQTKDTYFDSQNTLYARDQTTGEIIRKSAINTRTIMSEQFKSAKIIFARDTQNVSNGAFIANQTFATIPAGKVWILVSLTVCQNSYGGGAQHGYGAIGVNAANSYLVELMTANNTNESQTVNFANTIAFTSGVQFQTTLFAMGGIGAVTTIRTVLVAWEIDKSEFLNIN